MADTSVRLNIPLDQLQLTFNPADDKILNLCEPQFKFHLAARRVYSLGDVSWEVSIITDTVTKKIPIGATARAWQRQVILARPVAYRAIIQNDDVVEKRAMADHSPDATLLTATQCVGQEAARDLKPGMLMTAPMVNAVDLAKVGQTITVTLNSGGIHITTVGRAMEDGTYGQSIKVKNEATKEIYQVVLTGAQEGTITPPTPEKKSRLSRRPDERNSYEQTGALLVRDCVCIGGLHRRRIGSRSDFASHASNAARQRRTPTCRQRRAGSKRVGTRRRRSYRKCSRGPGDRS